MAPDAPSEPQSASEPSSGARRPSLRSVVPLTRRDDPQNVVPLPSSIPFSTFSGKLEHGPPID
jgi:hypothetical protein